MAYVHTQGISPMGVLGVGWGLAGACALLVRAIWSLTPMAVEAFTSFALGPLEWSVAAAWLAFMGYSEGYKGFQRGFAPRVIVRAAYLARAPRPLHVLLAPLFCIGLIHATRRRLVIGWTVVAMILVLVATLRFVPQPWRGIVDAGVVLGLGWGLVAVGVFGLRALAGRPPRVASDLPA